MRRSLLAAVTAVGLGSLGVGTAVAPAAETRTCSQLTGASIVDSPTIKVVREPSGDTELVSGCVLPDGPVRTINRDGFEGAEQDETTILATAGPFVAYRVDTTWFVDGGGSEARSAVLDLRDGGLRSVRDPCANYGTTVRNLLAPDGRMVVLARCSGGRTVLQGLRPRGGSIFLDVARRGTSIPADSVTIEGRVVRWTRGAAGRTGRI
jgi:hypothetical protein